jgi:chemotaxis protein CheD
MATLAIADPPASPVPCLYVHPGRVAASATPTVLHTVLGSCVSVCLWDEVAGVGGMNHFVLPESTGAPSARFAAPALEELVESLVARLRAKLFGGAGMLSAAPGEIPIGARNVERARALLADFRIPVVAESVGGRRGRKLLFETATGAAWLRLLAGGAR